MSLVSVFVFGEIELHACEAFGLDAEHHHDLRLPQCAIEVASIGDAGAGVGGGFGSNCGGPQRMTRAPRRGRRNMLERATRL